MAGPLILHYNARPHIADVVIENFAIMGWKCTSCALQSRRELIRLRLILKVKRTYAWATFFSLEELSFDVTQALRHMNKNGVFDGIIMLPKRGDSATEKQGDYIEGL